MKDKKIGFVEFKDRFKRNERSTVEFKDNLPGYRFTLGYRAPDNYVFERAPADEIDHCDIVSTGYQQVCRPTQDINEIRARQRVVEVFAEDTFSNSGDIFSHGFKKYYRVLNMMHLINTWERQYARVERHWTNAEFRMDKAGKILGRYLEEEKQLLDMLGKEKDLEEAVEGWKNDLKRKKVRTAIRALEQGGFDLLAVRLDKENNFQVYGLMGEHPELERGSKPVDSKGIQIVGFVRNDDDTQQHAYSGTTEWLGFDMRDFVNMAFSRAVHTLTSSNSKYACLFKEADWVAYRRKNGLSACKPEINDNGEFEMIDGEPIIDTPNPVGTSLSFDRKNSRTILNGLHSGGKTHLLCNIPLYYITGLSGFWLPARKAKIPLIGRIVSSIEIEKNPVGGSLESELKERAHSLKSLAENDLVVIDEFLQHASPDASDDLEPIILDEYYKTGATIIVVTHRGDSISDGEKWNFYSPGFAESGGRINPSYKFTRGKPPEEVLRRHARQILTDVMKAPVKTRDAGFIREPARLARDFSQYTHWIYAIEKRILSGGY